MVGLGLNFISGLNCIRVIQLVRLKLICDFQTKVLASTRSTKNINPNSNLTPSMAERLPTSTVREPKRYFVNSLASFDTDLQKKLDVKDWKQKISEIVSIVCQHQPPSIDDCDGGLYVGMQGVGYMLFHVSQSPVFAREKTELIKNGVEYMAVALEYTKNHLNDVKQKSSFLLGHCGVYAVTAALYTEAGMTDAAQSLVGKYITAASNCLPQNFLRCGGDELFVGRAGYLAGALWLNKLLGKGTIPDKEIHAICHSIVKSGQQYSQRHRSPSPLMFSYYQTEYLGAAHGLCAILQMLITCPNFIQADTQAEADIKGSIDFLLSTQTSSGNFPCALDELGSNRRSIDDELVHWCHGAPGVVYLMAKAYLIWKDEKYLQSCIKCGDLVWQQGLLKKGPGICHGIAGSGYVFLLLYRLTLDPVHLFRAEQFASFLFNSDFKRKARTPDCPYSLYEGLAGTACFLTDLLSPETASFPFQDVF